MPRHKYASHTAALLNIAGSLNQYAIAHKQAFGSPIGQDGVLGEAWITMLRELCSTLVGCGELGTLDGAEMARSLRDMAERHGFTRAFEDLP